MLLLVMDPGPSVRGASAPNHGAIVPYRIVMNIPPKSFRPSAHKFKPDPKVFSLLIFQPHQSINFIQILCPSYKSVTTCPDINIIHFTYQISYHTVAIELFEPNLLDDYSKKYWHNNLSEVFM